MSVEINFRAEVLRLPPAKIGVTRWPLMYRCYHAKTGWRGPERFTDVQAREVSAVATADTLTVKQARELIAKWSAMYPGLYHYELIA